MGCSVTELFEIGLPIGSNSLGNRVWYDSNHNGIDDFGEPGIAGVNVALWKDNNNDGNPETWQGFVTTDSDGYYMFTDLNPGIYQVFVWEIDNWGQGQPLYGMRNTIGNYDPNNDIDKDDNGQLAPEIQLLNDHNVICKPIILSQNGEPLFDGDREDPNIDYDPSGNMTIDFGFYAIDDDCPKIDFIISGSEMVCENESDGYLNVNLASGVPPYTFTWSNGNNGYEITDQPAGVYQVTVADVNGCISSIRSYTIDTATPEECILLSIEQTNVYNDEVSIYPNPFTKILNINNKSNKKLNYKIITIIGKTIKEGTILEGVNKLNLRSNTSGIYILYLFDSQKGSYAEFKVLKL